MSQITSSKQIYFHQQNKEESVNTFFSFLSMTSEITHFPYFTRSRRFNKALRYSNENNFMYELKGLGRITNLGMDVFLNYFACPFNQYYHRICNEQGGPNNIKVDNTHISQFFMVFLEVYLLQSCIGLNERITTSTISAINDLLGVETKKEYVSLKVYIKNRIENYFEQYARQRLFWSDPNTYNFRQSFHKVEKKIDEVIKKYFERVEANIEQIRTKECVPQDFENDILIKFIRYNFQRIRNVHVLRKGFKNQVLTQFLNTIRRHMFIRIEFLIETLSSTSKNSNLIYMPKYSREVQPVISEFHNYLSSFTRSQSRGQGDYQLVLYAFMKKIVEICLQYHEDTRNVYPNISIDDFMIDYRTLLPLISHNSLILDGIGFRGQTKSIELRLATEPCPQYRIQQSHLQSQQKWAFVRKYYFPRKSAKNADTIQQENEKQRLFQTEASILQNVHVWRILNILCQIANETNIAANEYRRLRQQRMYLSDYQQRLKHIYNDLKQGRLRLQDILPISKKVAKYKEQQGKEVKQTDKNQKFQFQMAHLASKFDIEFNHDSLLQSLRFQNIKEYLEQRDYFSHEINYIILYQKAFKKFINAKKYAISFFTNAIQVLNFNVILRDPAQKYLFKTELIKYLQLTDFFQGLDKRSGTIKAVLDKLDDYRSRNDSNSKYLDSSKLDNIIKEISMAIQEINLLKEYENQMVQPRQDDNDLKQKVQIVLDNMNEQEKQHIKELQILTERQIKPNNNQQQNIQKKVRKKINDAIFVKSKHIMQRTIQLFSKLMNEQIKPYVDDPSIFHSYTDLKLQRPLQKQVFKYINYKVVTVIQMYLTMTISTFRRSQQTYSGSAFDILREGKRINQDITISQIERKMQRMLVCRNYIKHQMPQGYFREHKVLLANLQKRDDHVAMPS